MNLLLEMTLMSSSFIIIVIIIRALIIYKIPKKTFMILWYIALFQLLIPFSIPSQISILNLIDSSNNVSELLTISLSDTEHLVNSDFIWQPQENFNTADMAIPTTNNLNHSIGFVGVVALIYLMGLCASTIFFIVLYSKNRKEFITSIPISNEFTLNWLIMYFLTNRDMEVSCDEAVINMFGETSKQGYALTLISMVGRRSHFPNLYNNFSKYAIVVELY